MKELIIKCKPVYDFQSVEFEYLVDLDNPETINDMFTFYDTIIEGLKNVAPSQPNAKQAPKKPPVEKATEGQIKCLVGLGLSKEEASNMSKVQASIKIKEMLGNE